MASNPIMSVRKDTVRIYIRVVPILSLVAGMSFVDGLQAWHANDSDYWMAFVTVPICLGAATYFTRQILNEFS
jgi:hypothetical protein